MKLTSSTNSWFSRLIVANHIIFQQEEPHFGRSIIDELVDYAAYHFPSEETIGGDIA